MNAAKRFVSVCMFVFPATDVAVGSFGSEYLDLRRMVGRGEYTASFERCRAMIVQYPGEGVLYDALGEIALYAGRTDDAMAFLWERVEDGTGLSLCYFGLGSLSYRREDDRNAIMFLSKAIELGVKVPECYSSFVYSYERLEGIDATLKLLTMLCHRNPDEAGYWYALALAHWVTGDFAQVLRQLDEALRLNPNQERYHHASVTAMMLTAKYGDADNHLSEMIAAARSMNDFNGLLLMKSGLVVRRQQQGRIESAISECNELIAVSRQFGFVRWSGWGYKQLSDIYSVLSRYRESVNFAEGAFASARLCADFQLMHASLVRSFDSNLEMLNIAAAIQCLARRIETHSSSKSSTYLISIFLDASRLFMIMGQPDVALELAIAALGMFERAGSNRRLHWEVHSTLGNVYEQLGDMRSALRHYKTTETILPEEPFYARVQAIANGNMGSVYLRMGMLDEALKKFGVQLEFAKAANYVREEAYGYLHTGIAELARDRRLPAKRALIQALKISRRDSIQLCTILALRSLADLYLLDGDTARAEASLRRHMGTRGHDIITVRPFLGNSWERGSGYRGCTLDELLCAQGKFKEGFLLSEERRTQSRLGFIRDWREINRAAITDTALSGVSRLSDRLGSAVESLSSNSEAYGVFSAIPQELLLQFPMIASLYQQREQVLESYESRHGMDRFRANPKPLGDFGQVQQGLADSEAIVSFVLGRERSFVCLIRNDTVAFNEMLVSRDSLRSLITSLAHITNPSEFQVLILSPLLHAGDLDLLARAYDATIKPIEGHLAGCSRIFVVLPEGVPPIPFDLLIRQEAGSSMSSPFQRSQFLVERFDICYLPGLANLLVRESDTPIGGPSWIGFGNPDLASRPTQDFDPEIAFIKKHFGLNSRGRITSVEREIDQIQRGFGESAVAFMGQDATRARLLSVAGSADIVHIAAHGHLREREPWISGLTLSSSAQDQNTNLLTAHEIFEGPIARQLLVLSGCNSLRAVGIWSPESGLWLPSPGQAPLIGTWSIVDDRGSAELMLRLYEHLREGYCTSMALTLAKRDVIRETGGRSPSWASFSHIGVPVTFDLAPSRLGSVEEEHKLITWGSVLLLLSVVIMAALWRSCVTVSWSRR